MNEVKAIVRHTMTVYDALASESRQEGDFLIFRGAITRVFRDTGIAQTYYTPIFKQLEEQGCINIIQRGSRSVDSVVVLDHPPTPENFVEPAPSPLTDPERYANLREDVEGLKTLVGGMNIVEAFKEVERRLRKLEESIAAKVS